MGEYPVTAKGNKFILVITDYFTRYTELHPLKRLDGETVAHTVLTKACLRYGFPRRILSDQGSQFASAVFQGLFKSVGVKTMHSAPYNPAAEFCERRIQSLKVMVQMFADSEQKKWDMYLPHMQYALNTSVSETTKFSPFEMLFGRQEKDPFRVAIQEDGDKELFQPVGTTEKNWIGYHTAALEKYIRLARQNQESALKRYKGNYDAKIKTIPYAVGDKVWVVNRKKSSADEHYAQGLAPKFIGPYLITKIYHDAVVLLKEIDTDQILGTRSMRDLKPFVPATSQVQKANVPGYPPIVRQRLAAPDPPQMVLRPRPRVNYRY
jgi:transposase InsO family protein